MQKVVYLLKIQNLKVMQLKKTLVLKVMQLKKLLVLKVMQSLVKEYLLPRMPMWILKVKVTYQSGQKKLDLFHILLRERTQSILNLSLLIL